MVEKHPDFIVIHLSFLFKRCCSESFGHVKNSRLHAIDQINFINFINIVCVMCYFRLILNLLFMGKIDLSEYKAHRFMEICLIDVINFGSRFSIRNIQSSKLREAAQKLSPFPRHRFC